MAVESPSGARPRDQPQDPQVRQELDRLLASASFRNGARLSRLLRFVVEAQLDGRSAQLKEYVLGTEVFERPSFDPRMDTVVRSTARHLRFKLDEYYKTEGCDDPLVIELPKGSYVPVFRARPPKIVSVSRPRLWWSLAVLAAVIAAAGTLVVRARMRAVADSLVVLPFENRTGRAADQYVVDGLTQELTDGFVRIPGLRVIGRTSAVAAAGRDEDIRKIGASLNVATVLSGVAENSGGRIRVSARLASTRDGRLLWSETMVTDARNIDALERPILEAVARTLRFTQQPARANPDTANAEAHDLYIQGRNLWSRRDPDSVRRSVTLLTRATEKDPNYALAYTGLADAYAVMAAGESVPPAEGLGKAEAAASRALSLDPGSAEAHASLGLIRNAEWDWQGAVRELRVALKLNPGYAPTYARLAVNETVHGHFQDAEALLRQAQILDPLNWMLTYSVGENAYYARRYDEAIAQARKIEAYAPVSACNLLGRAYLGKGMIADAWAAVECEHPKDAFQLAVLRAVLMPDRTAGTREFRRLAAQAQPSAGPFFMAWTAAWLHQSDLALSWLDKAFAMRDPDLASIRVEPALESLHDEPRYRELVRKVGLAP